MRASLLILALHACAPSAHAWPWQQSTFGDLDDALHADRICADLLKGDFTAASEPIRQKTVIRELTFDTVITWLARNIPSPYVELPRSPTFLDLPKDQGTLTTCRQQDGFSLTGNEIEKSLYLGYPASRLTVTLRYSGLSSPRLDYIQIGKPEKTFPGQEEPDALARRMADFARKLDAQAAKDGH